MARLEVEFEMTAGYQMLVERITQSDNQITTDLFIVALPDETEAVAHLRRRLPLTTEKIVVFGFAPTFTLAFLKAQKGDVFRINKVASCAVAVSR